MKALLKTLCGCESLKDINDMDIREDDSVEIIITPSRINVYTIDKDIMASHLPPVKRRFTFNGKTVRYSGGIVKIYEEALIP